jgi:hypothetical protein
MNNLIDLQHENDVEKYVQDISKNISGFSLLKSERKILTEDERIVYGEILQSSVTKLIKNLDIKNTDVVYDLGSGIGKFCLQVFLQTECKKVSGIELIKSRHDKAEIINQKVKDDFSSKYVNRELSFINKSFMLSNLMDATVIYLASTCFNNEFLNSIFLKISKIPKLRALISLKKFVRADISPFNSIEEIELPCSWKSNQKAFIYTKM